MAKFLFLGAGNLVKSLCLGLKEQDKKKIEKKLEFYFYTPTLLRAKELAKEMNPFVDSYVVDDLDFFIKEKGINLDYVVLAFKPQQLVEITYHKPLFKQNKNICLISLLACLSFDTLEKWALINDLSMIRVCPTTNMQVLSSVNLMVANKNLSIPQKEFVGDIFSLVGKNIFCENEKEFDFLTPFSGCSPALFFYLMEILTNHLKKETSLSEEKIYDLLFLTLQGSLETMKQGKGISFLNHEREKVTSKGGVTEKLINTLKEENLSGLMEKSFRESHKKIEEIKKLFV